MTESLRPNIRIEIQNDLVEPMELGEIVEPVEEPKEPVRHTQRVWPNTEGGFNTGINIFDKVQQTKLTERAKRFSLKPEEIRNFTDEQLQELHDSLGVTTEDEKDIRFEALHMHGTDELSTEDVLEYFHKYGPSGVEWINDESCNVLWTDRVSAARALFFLSRPIGGMPVEGPCDPFVKELDENKKNGKSILLKTPTVEVKGDIEVSVGDIAVPIPPGYWRLGTEHPKSKCILVRFAFKSDKKQSRAEKFSEYYKKYGNPNYGGMKGIISETRKNRFKGLVLPEEEVEEGEEEEDSKNPWGNLAKNWEQRETERPIIPVKSKSDILSRIGFKRSLEDESKIEENKEKKVKIPRMRMYADEEEEKIKRKKQLQKLKNRVEEQTRTQTQPRDDLRDVLNTQTSKKAIKLEKPEVDLGLKLKNRQKITQKTQRTPIRRRPSPDRYIEDRIDTQKPRSKVAVVIKTQKKPSVASTIWSRIASDRQRLKTVSEGKLRRRSSSSESDSPDSVSSKGSDSEIDMVRVKAEPADVGKRPGFHSNLAKRLQTADHRSPLRIEINNDHFKKE